MTSHIPHLFAEVGGKIFEKTLPSGMSNFSLPGGDDKNLWESGWAQLNHHSQSVSQSGITFSQKRLTGLFMKLHLKLWIKKKVVELDFLRKISFWGERPKMSP